MTSSTFYNDIEVRGVVKSLAGKSIGTVTEMSAATGKNKGCAVLYLGAESGYTAGMVYVSDGEEWVPQGKIVTVDSAVKDGSTNPVSGDAVYGAIDTVKSESITGLSVSGTTITYTKGNGTTGTITTQDKNTDTKVTQKNSTANKAYPILLKNGTGTGSTTNSVIFDSDVTINPSTGAITAAGGFIGTATKATQDGDGNVIASTYSKAVTGSALAVSWATDTTVSGYSYKGTITLAGVTADHVPVVTFDPATANSGKYCPVAESGAGVVYIWSTSNTATTVQSVVATLP